MRLLLDTHVAIWALVSPDLLASQEREIIADPANEIHVSAASVWEIAIRRSLPRPNPPPFSGADAVRYFRKAGYVMLDVTGDHAARVEALPPLHNDPFDRLIVAQALAEPMRLITHDRNVAAYSDTILLF